jgi:hypothetical protein
MSMVSTHTKVILTLLRMNIILTSNLHMYFDFDTHDCDFKTHKSDFYTQSLILTCMSVTMTLTSVITTSTSVIYTRTSWISIENRLWLAAIPHARVWFSHHACDAAILPVILALWMWFWHSACDLNNHACDFHTHACDCHTLRVKLLKLNQNYKHMPVAVRKTCVSNKQTTLYCNRSILRVDLTPMHVGSTRMRVQNLYFYAFFFPK